MKKQVIALAMIVVAFALGGCTFVASDEVAVKKADFEAMKAEIKRLREAPPTQVTQGITQQQCTAIVENALKNQCVGKTETITKTVTKYRDRPMGKVKPQPPALAAPCPACGQASGQTRVGATSETIWLWHPHTASDANPQPCVIEAGSGAGLPPRCSGFKVVGRTPDESKHQWLLRVGGGKNPTDTGTYQKQ